MAWTAHRRARGLGEAIPIRLVIDSPVQTVGQRGTYRIIGAPPGAEIFWSSYKNGVATGELNSSYGHTIEPNGTASISMGSPWTDDQTGNWIKEILVKDASGNISTAMVPFTVVGAGSGAPAAAPASTNPLTSSINIAGINIPMWVPVAAVVAVVAMKK